MCQVMELNLKDKLTNSKLDSLLHKPHQELPFQLYVFQKLISDANQVEQLRRDINSHVKLKKKDNDLYKFYQSKDLLTETSAKKLTPLIHNFIDALQDDVRKHLEKLTGKKLSSKHLDITASRYELGNHLLCHNDHIKNSNKNHQRAFAFVYYLTARPWTKQDGGSLILFESDASGEPIKVSNSIPPQPNTLVVFETTKTSWHSVDEVLCKDDLRLSINGWFHSDTIDQGQTIDEPPDERIEPCPFELNRPIPLDERLEKFFKDYVNPEYLMEKTCLMIKKRFKRDSEINLTNFLNPDKFKEINEALRQTISEANSDNLEHVGPFNKRNYHRIKNLPQVCRDLYDAFRSELFFMFLSRITGLDLQPPSLRSDDANSHANSSSKESGDSDSDESDVEGEDLDLEDDSEMSDEDDDSEDEDDDDNVDDNVDDDDDVVVVDKEENKHDVKSEQQQIGPIKSIVDQYKGEKSSLAEPVEPDVDRPTTSKQRSHENVRGKKRRRISDPLARLDFRLLQAGSYTLIHDYGFEMGEQSALDVILHFNHEFEVNFDHGGYISYIDCLPEEDPHDMESELLTIEPKSNCLSLAYRCEGTSRFLKYISRSHKSAYQDLSCVYYERPDDLPAKSVANISSGPISIDRQ